MSFCVAFNHIMDISTGYGINDHDGETYCGISRNRCPNWPGWRVIDQIKSKVDHSAEAIDVFFKADHEDALIKVKVKEFYYNHFWKPVVAFGLYDRLTEKLFDAAALMGVNGAVGVLQRAVNELSSSIRLNVNGNWEPETSKAVWLLLQKNLYEEALIEKISEIIVLYYHEIVKKDKSQSKYLDGWLRRATWMPF